MTESGRIDEALRRFVELWLFGAVCFWAGIGVANLG